MSATDLLVSVIIPSFKMGRFVDEALSSVGEQTFPQWEVIVVDDAGPDDGTRVAVQDFATRHNGNRVEYHRVAVNQGVGPARNRAAELAKGQVLAFLDPDDIWLPLHLEKALIDLCSNDLYDIYCSPAQLFWEERSNLGELWSFNGWFREFFPWSLASRNLIAPSGVVMRTQVFSEIGGFATEEQLQHVEDYDLWIRLVRKEKRFLLAEHPTFLYRKHAAAASMGSENNIMRVESLMKRHAATFCRMQGRLLGLVAQSVEQAQATRSGSKNPILVRCLRRLIPRF